VVYEVMSFSSQIMLSSL